MSTRGWYEYYTINPKLNQITLSLQFYKWGNATPENAHEEWKFFEKQLIETDECLPIPFLDDMLRQQLSSLYPNLPGNFSTALFLFMPQRARETSGYFSQWKWEKMDMPLKQRPDYRLGYAIGRAITKKKLSENSLLQKFITEFDEANQSEKISRKELKTLYEKLNNATRSEPETQNKYIETVIEYAITGEYIRPWKNYGLKLSVLEWLQYLTQVTLKTDMGSICGRFSRPWDCDFVYRFFIWHDPTAPFKIKKIAVEFCDRDGENLFPSNYPREKQEISEAYVEEDYESLLLKMRGSNIELFSLNQALRKYELTPDIFWEVENYEHPPLINPSLKNVV